MTLEDWLELVKHKKDCKKKDKKSTYYIYTSEKGSVNFIEVNYTQILSLHNLSSNRGYKTNLESDMKNVKWATREVQDAMNILCQERLLLPGDRVQSEKSSWGNGIN